MQGKIAHFVDGNVNNLAEYDISNIGKGGDKTGLKIYEQKYRTKVDPNYTVEDILEEITADGATAYMNDEKFAENVAKEDKSLAKKIADFFKDIAETLKKLINKKRHTQRRPCNARE